MSETIDEKKDQILKDFDETGKACDEVTKEIKASKNRLQITFNIQ